jgi:impB/mucB/samB family C-terminal domain
MEKAGVRGRTITLKLMRRKAGAPEAPKFLGHGICDNLSRSITLPRFTASAHDFFVEGRNLLRALKVPADQIRGMGLAVPPPFVNLLYRLYCFASCAQLEVHSCTGFRPAHSRHTCILSLSLYQVVSGDPLLWLEALGGLSQTALAGLFTCSPPPPQNKIRNNSKQTQKTHKKMQKMCQKPKKTKTAPLTTTQTQQQKYR